MSERESCTGPLPHHPTMRLMAGAWLVVLVSFVINDRHQPGPLAIAATMVILLILGRAAVSGVRWLARESDVRFPSDRGRVPLQARVGKLVPWIGFGTALPASVLVTLLMLVGWRPPMMMGRMLVLLLLSFVPTLVLCLMLAPYARAQAASDWCGERDRGVFPLFIGLSLYALGGFILVVHSPLQLGFWRFIGLLLRLVGGSVMPVHLPQHIIAVSVACAVLRGWFCGTACMLPPGAGGEGCGSAGGDSSATE